MTLNSEARDNRFQAKSPPINTASGINSYRRPGTFIATNSVATSGVYVALCASDNSETKSKNENNPVKTNNANSDATNTSRPM